MLCGITSAQLRATLPSTWQSMWLFHAPLWADDEFHCRPSIRDKNTTRGPAISWYLLFQASSGRRSIVSNPTCSVQRGELHLDKPFRQACGSETRRDGSVGSGGLHSLTRHYDTSGVAKSFGLSWQHLFPRGGSSSSCENLGSTCSSREPNSVQLLWARGLS